MSEQHFPALDSHAIGETKEALHAYSSVLGAWLKTCRPNLIKLWTEFLTAGREYMLEVKSA